MANEVRLVNLKHYKLAFGVGQATVIDRVERQLPTFTGASQNVAVEATLLDMLPAPSTDGVGEGIQRLKNILGATAT
jgi:hypothetical protein